MKPPDKLLDLLNAKRGKLAHHADNVVQLPRPESDAEAEARAKAEAGIPAHARTAAALPPKDAPEPLRGIRKNDGWDWLTYETLFNQRPFRKTNQKKKLGLYRIPLAKVRVFVRDGIPREQLETLAAAFFPQTEVELIEALSLDSCEWKAGTGPVTDFTRSPREIASSRVEAYVHLAYFAVLPFNYEDNCVKDVPPLSGPIGIAETTAGQVRLVKLKREWDFWKTASRSTVVELKPVMTERDALWGPLKAQPFGWPHPTSLQAAEVGSSERGEDLRAVPDPSTHLRLSETDGALFGVKTGVRYIGSNDQGGGLAGKAHLEENSVIACLRSDLIAQMDERAGRRHPERDVDLLVQTELLSITEKLERKYGDGIQVRDLGVLDRTKIYFPPISIPFVDRGLRDLKRRFECVDDDHWSAFWCDTYAKTLGRAKALLLLRYGLQMGSPNAQNFLIEFTPGKPPVPTGRIVMRDVGDMYLHREVLWAKLGGKELWWCDAGGQPLVDGNGDPAKLDQKLIAEKLATLPSKVINFECTKLKYSGSDKWREYLPYETGSIYGENYGPLGTRLLWHSFSTLATGMGVKTESKSGKDFDCYSTGWQKVCATMCAWGKAHAQAYVEYIEQELNVKLSGANRSAEDPPIVWADAPGPERYEHVEATDKGAAERLWLQDRDWEYAQERKLHRWLASKAGHETLVEYYRKQRVHR